MLDIDMKGVSKRRRGGKNTSSPHAIKGRNVCKESDCEFEVGGGGGVEKSRGCERKDKSRFSAKRCDRWACIRHTHTHTHTHTHIHTYIHINPSSSLLCARDDVMPSENMWGGGVGGFRGGFLWSFQVCRGSLGPRQGRQYEGRRLNAATPPPPQQAVTLGTLRPHHQRPGSLHARTHTHTHTHTHSHMHTQKYACAQLLRECMYGPTSQMSMFTLR